MAYDTSHQAAYDAGVKAERERCAKVCRGLARIQREWAKDTRVPEFKREHGRAAAQLEIAAQEIERGEG